MGTFTLVEQLERKWQPVMEHDSLSPIKDNYRRAVTSILLENQEQALREASSSVSSVGSDGLGYGATNGLAGYDPILISLVRRAMPNLMAYDVASVQPMTSPTGLIFAMKSTYNNRTGPEALFNEAYTDSLVVLLMQQNWVMSLKAPMLEIRCGVLQESLVLVSVLPQDGNPDLV